MALVLASQAGQSGDRIVGSESLLPAAGVVLGVVLKWAFDSLTERSRRHRKDQLRGWDVKRETYAQLRQRAADAYSGYASWVDATARDLDLKEVKEREYRYLRAADAAVEQVRTIELLAPKHVADAALNLVRALPDIVSHEEEPVLGPDYQRSWLLPVQTSARWPEECR
jgi:hypothetical protein